MPVMTEAQLRSIYHMTGLYEEGWVDDDFIEDAARFVGATNQAGTAYDPSKEVNVGIEVLLRAIPRLAEAEPERARAMRQRVLELRNHAAVVTTTITPPATINTGDGTQVVYLTAPPRADLDLPDGSQAVVWMSATQTAAWYERDGGELAS